MLKEQWAESIEDLNKKMAAINAKIEDASETAEIKGMEAQNAIEAKIAEMKGNVVAAQEQFRLATEQSERKLNSELIKAQSNMDAMKQAIEEKKLQMDQVKMGEYISNSLDYANQCQALAALLLEEAKLAELQAESAIVSYEEMYGGMENK